MRKNTDIGLLILRVTISILMLLHGVAKLGSIGGVKALLDSAGLPTFLAYGVYLTEIVAPLLILIGYRTRIATSVYMFGVLVAIFLAHSNDIFSLNKYGGWGVELLGLYLFGALTLFFTGSGKYAISSSHKWD